ncbi:MAG: hypothetical protein WAU01_04695 [Saprospiraceae bacterium]
MIIKASATVQDIFDQFHTLFPYLKLEFYKHGHAENKGSKIEDQVSHESRLKSLNPHIETTEMEIDPLMTVSELEQMMKEKFNLHVQVFRKSSDLWLQTSATDHWTLEKQNGKGQRSTEDYGIEPLGITDFDVD